MDSFLKRSTANFVLKLLKNVKSTSKTLNCLSDLSEFFNLGLSQDISKVSYSNFSAEFEEALLKKKFSKVHTVIENKIKIISKIYHLSDIEYGYFLYFICKNKINEFEDFIDCFDGSINNFVGRLLLNYSSSKSKEAVNSLEEKGIICESRNYRRCSSYTINDNIMEILDDVCISGEKKIRSALLGKSLFSDLEWNDYNYLEKERGISSEILKAAVSKKSKGINILLYGDVGTGKTEFAKIIANKLKINLFAVTCEDNDKSEASRHERLSDLRSKQTILSVIDNSCILFDEAEDVINKGFFGDRITSKAYLNSIIENTPVPIIWTTNDILNVDPAVLRRMTYTIHFEKLTEDIRLNIWKKIAKKNKFKIDKDKLIDLNKKYEIQPSIIANAIKTTKLIGGNQDILPDFIESITKVVRKKKNVSKKTEFDMNGYNDSLVNTDLNLTDLTEKIQNSGKINFSLCLYGEPGTGKSLYAKYLAGKLGLECIHKRASDLMSKWVGENEQNIADAFAEAKAKKAMLIIDEADSFLQTRTNAQRSWEVSMVNEMLTQMESHEYPFVCTTNLLDTLDEASLRRFTFKIKFDFMSAEQVNDAFEHFFGIQDAHVNIKGLTAGDFATVKKKADFLNITDKSELEKMLMEEVKVKKSKTLQNTVGFN